jgi:TolB-like protein/Tfp pilus assembly protein PilF
MTPERYRQIGELFHAALEVDTGQRAAFLERGCAGDMELRHEVESLINSHEVGKDFIAAPALSVAAEMLATGEANSLTGQTIARYRVLSLVGTGGMGRVYLAEDAALNRRVALKLLPEPFTNDKNQLQRFHQEARAASALNHPNIVTVYEVGAWQGRDFIATEFVEGVTLRTRMRGRGLPLGAAIDIVLQVAGALTAAHAAGIVHRDIKPENIMIRPDGLVKILDFGIAKYAGPKGDRDSESWVKTATGVVIGTTAYMSPEQARGQEVDARADIWSLGVILYEMVARRLPFLGKTPTDRLAAILHHEPMPLRKLRRGVPAELEHVVSRALAKDKGNRYAKAADLAEDLRKLRVTLGVDRPFRFALPAPSRARLLSGQRKSVALAALLLVIAAASVALLAYFRVGASRRGAQLGSHPAAIDSIAVLPLENLSGDPSQEYFADGMTDALIGDLAKIRGLQVISRTSAMHYKGSKKSLREIADELKVDALVEGTVQRSGDHVVVRAQLIQAATDRHIWSETYDRDLRDVLAMQGEIAEAVVREIQIKLVPAERARLTTNRPVNRKAFDDYLQGRFLYFNKYTDENLHRAISFYESAIKEDPGYALAYVGLAECYAALGTEQISALPPKDSRRQAEEAAGKALALDNELAEAHVALGFVKHFNWEWAAAEQEFKLAIELNPNSAFGHLRYGALLVSEGRMLEGVAEANRAQELDPFSLSISALRGFLLENARRYDEAIEQLHRVISMDQNNYSAHWYLGHTYAASGRFQEAIAASEKAVAISRTTGALGFLGMNYGLAGRKAEAKKILNELLELKRHHYVTPPALANVYIGLGDKDQAFFWLEKAYQEQSNYLTWLKVFPADDPLRSDPRLDDLLRRIGLTAN